MNSTRLTVSYLSFVPHTSGIRTLMLRDEDKNTASGPTPVQESGVTFRRYRSRNVESGLYPTFKPQNGGHVA